MGKLKTLPELSDWLERICKSKPQKSVIAFNIGLIQTEGGYAAYLVGSKHYEDDSDDWACDESFTPRERYCGIITKGLRGWKQVLNAVVATVHSFLESGIGKESFLGKAVAVTAGFDDGELVRIKARLPDEGSQSVQVRHRKSLNSVHFYEVNLPERRNDRGIGIANFPKLFLAIDFVYYLNEVENWKTPKARLQGGDYCDYLPNYGRVRLVSRRLREFFEINQHKNDPLQFLPVKILSTGDNRDYFIMHFKKDLKPLNRKATQWIGNWYPRIPVIRKTLIGRHHLFALSGTGTDFVASNELKTKLDLQFPECFTFKKIATA